MVIYRVREGDTVASIARGQAILPTRLCELNGISADTRPAIGEALVIAGDAKVYYVKEGDTLRGIAARHRIPLAALMRQNPTLGGREDIYPGMTLTVGNTDCPRGAAVVLGYASGDTDADALTPILPYLTYLAVIGATLGEGGRLCPTEDAAVVSLARRAGVAPLLAVTLCEAEDGPLTRMLTTGEGRDATADAIAAHMRLRGYGGVLLDMPSLLPAGHEAYNALLGRLRRLTGHGMAVFATLSPMAMPTDRTVLASLGRAANGLVLTAYDFATRYGAPAPEAPYDRVKEALAALNGCVRPQKLLLGLSTRAEDFPVKGGEGRILPAAAIPSLARERDGRISYDPVGRVPYLSYIEGDEERIVFFEDAESFCEKLWLCAEGGLGGVALFPAEGVSQPLLSAIAQSYSVIRPYGC